MGRGEEGGVRVTTRSMDGLAQGGRINVPMGGAADAAAAGAVPSPGARFGLLAHPLPPFFFFSVVVAVFGVLCLCGCEGADDAHRADQVTNLVAASLILMTAGQAVRGAHQLLYDWGKKEGY